MGNSRRGIRRGRMPITQLGAFYILQAYIGHFQHCKTLFQVVVIG